MDKRKPLLVTSQTLREGLSMGNSTEKAHRDRYSRAGLIPNDKLVSAIWEKKMGLDKKPEPWWKRILTIRGKQ